MFIMKVRFYIGDFGLIQNCPRQVPIFRSINWLISDEKMFNKPWQILNNGGHESRNWIGVDRGRHYRSKLYVSVSVYLVSKSNEESSFILVTSVLSNAGFYFHVTIENGLLNFFIRNRSSPMQIKFPLHIKGSRSKLNETKLLYFLKDLIKSCKFSRAEKMCVAYLETKFNHFTSRWIYFFISIFKYIISFHTFIFTI